MESIPSEDFMVTLAAVACQTGRHAVFTDTGASLALRYDVVNRFGRFTAVDAALVGELVERLPPAS